MNRMKKIIAMLLAVMLMVPAVVGNAAVSPQKVSIAKAMAMAATAISLQIPNRTQIPRKMPILLLNHAPRHPNRSPEVPLPGLYCCCAVDLPLCADA